MSHAIRVDGRFGTAHDTARILGVSKSRTEALIKIARRYTDRILKAKAAKDGLPVGNGHSRTNSGATVVVRKSNARKSSGRNAGTKISATKSKKAKARR